MFRVGQLVCCIKRDAWVGQVDKLVVEGPRYNEVLRISGFDCRGGLLFDKWNYRYPNGEPRGFNEVRFRPIVSRPTSIAVFEEILRKVNAPGRVSEVAHHA